MDWWDHIHLHSEFRNHYVKWKLHLHTSIANERRYSSVDGEISSPCSHILSVRLIAKDSVCMFKLALIAPKSSHVSQVRRPFEIGCVVLCTYGIVGVQKF
jgi:hypothetical protein